MSTAGTIPWPPRWTSAVIVRCETSHDPSRHHSATPRANTPTVMAVSRAPRAKTGVYAARLAHHRNVSLTRRISDRQAGQRAKRVRLCGCGRPANRGARARNPWPPLRGTVTPLVADLPLAASSPRWPARSRRSRPGMSARWCGWIRQLIRVRRRGWAGDRTWAVPAGRVGSVRCWRRSGRRPGRRG
jgi:hypothetical protein